MNTYQKRVDDWASRVFSDDIKGDKVERAMRFLEEATELAQATGLTAEKAHVVVDYVFGRPIGQSPQEVGGVMVTLAVLCQTLGHSMTECAEIELARIDTPEMREKIAAKQVSKRLFGMSGPSYDREHGRPLRDKIAQALIDYAPDGTDDSLEECADVVMSVLSEEMRGAGKLGEP